MNNEPNAEYRGTMEERAMTEKEQSRWIARGESLARVMLRWLAPKKPQDDPRHERR